jgi:putative DNA primase/helicase
MTGGDRLKARFMHQDFFEFSATHKIFLATNHKPIVRGTDNAIWRRIRLIPFTVTIPDHEQDKHLIEKLRAELPGILAWSVEGALKWRKHGLEIPHEVSEATSIYRVEMDSLQNFINEKIVKSENDRIKSSELYKAYTDWCAANGERPLAITKFVMRLKERSFEKKPRSDAEYWIGITVNNQKSEAEWPSAG